MHFHWGSEDDVGSTHTLQGNRFAAEAHLIFQYDYKFKAPLEILEAHRKLADLKWKVEHPDEEEEEEEDDDEEEEEEEEETEEEMLERYERDVKNFEILQKKKMDEWGEKRREIIENDKSKGRDLKGSKVETKKDEKDKTKPAEEDQNDKSKDRNLNDSKVETKKEEKDKTKPAEEDPASLATWDAMKREVTNSGIILEEKVWKSLFEKFVVSKEAAEMQEAANNPQTAIKQVPQQRVEKPAAVATEISPEEKNLSKARKLETETMLRLELAHLETCKSEYTVWIKAEEKLNKVLKRELRESYEAFQEELEEREELEDDEDIPEEEKRKTRIRWTIADEKKEQAVRDKLKGVLDRRKQELDKICTKDITCLAIVGLIFKADKAAPPYNLFTFLTHVQEAFEETEVDGNLMKQFQSGLSTSDYFTYSGSTTHSPYSENVTWFVMRDPLPIQPAQVDCLRKMKGEWGPIYSNSREVQSLGSRQIFFNQKPVSFQPTVCPGKELCCDKNMPKQNWSGFI
ncbi:uncharacterized protein isoform X2 [Rhodnius prolixus]